MADNDIPSIELRDLEIPRRIIDMVPQNIALIYRVVPFRQEGDSLCLATADPTNTNQLDNLERLLDQKVKPFSCTPDDVRDALMKYYGANMSTVEKMLSTMSSASRMASLSDLTEEIKRELRNGKDLAGRMTSPNVMTHRERVLRTFRFEPTDRVAYDLRRNRVIGDCLGRLC